MSIFDFETIQAEMKEQTDRQIAAIFKECRYCEWSENDECTLPDGQDCLRGSVLRDLWCWKVKK